MSDSDDLFGSEPPSSPEFSRTNHRDRRRSPSPALALPGAQNVGTIALPGSRLLSELVLLPPSTPPAPPTPSSSSLAHHPPPSTSTSTSKRKSQPRATSEQRASTSSHRPKQKPRTKRQTRSETPRPPPPPFDLPDPTQPTPPHFLRNHQALLGLAGLVSHLSASRLPTASRPGESADNPIVLVDQANQVQKPIDRKDAASAATSLPVLPQSDEVLAALVRSKNLAPVLASIARILSSTADASPEPGPTHTPSPPPPSQSTSSTHTHTHTFSSTPTPTPPSTTHHAQPHPHPQTHAPPLKRRKLSRVPAGAADWDVPYPFPPGEGPTSYRSSWARARVAALLAQLLALVKAATRSAAARRYLALVGRGGRGRAEEEARRIGRRREGGGDAGGSGGQGEGSGSGGGEIDKLMALFANADDDGAAALFADFPLANPSSQSSQSQNQNQNQRAIPPIPPLPQLDFDFSSLGIDFNLGGDDWMDFSGGGGGFDPTAWLGPVPSFDASSLPPPPVAPSLPHSQDTSVSPSMDVDHTAPASASPTPGPVQTSAEPHAPPMPMPMHANAPFVDAGGFDLSVLDPALLAISFPHSSSSSSTPMPSYAGDEGLQGRYGEGQQQQQYGEGQQQQGGFPPPLGWSPDMFPFAQPSGWPPPGQVLPEDIMPAQPTGGGNDTSVNVPPPISASGARTSAPLPPTTILPTFDTRASLSSASSTPSLAVSPTVSMASLGPLTPSASWDVGGLGPDDGGEEGRRRDKGKDKGKRRADGGENDDNRKRKWSEAGSVGDNAMADEHHHHTPESEGGPPPPRTFIWDSRGPTEDGLPSWRRERAIRGAHPIRTPLSAQEILAAQNLAVERERAASNARFLSACGASGENERDKSGEEGQARTRENSKERDKGKGKEKEKAGAEDPAASAGGSGGATGKAAIITRARARREELARELEKTRIELWEAVIEGGVLGFVVKEAGGVVPAEVRKDMKV